MFTKQCLVLQLFDALWPDSGQIWKIFSCKVFRILRKAKISKSFPSVEIYTTFDVRKKIKLDLHEKAATMKISATHQKLNEFLKRFFFRFHFFLLPRLTFLEHFFNCQSKKQLKLFSLLFAMEKTSLYEESFDSLLFRFVKKNIFVSFWEEEMAKKAAKKKKFHPYFFLKISRGWILSFM